MSWTEEEADRIKRNDEQRETARKWEFHKAEVLAERAVEVWSSVVKQVKKDLAALNAGFAAQDERRQIELEEMPAFGLALKKKSGLALQVIVRMAPTGRAIDIRVREVRNSLGVPVDLDESIAVDLDERENIFFRTTTRLPSVEAVSKTIFQPFIRNFE